MKNKIYNFEEFSRLEMFGFLTSDKSVKKVSNRMVIGQLVCVKSSMNNIIHVYQLSDNDRGIFIGNLKRLDTLWVFKVTSNINSNEENIIDYRPLKYDEKKMVQWQLPYIKQEEIFKITKLPIIL